MDESSSLGWLVVGAVALLVSALVTRLAIGYAHRYDLLDRPGQRRSHQTPTPRGGGIGIVVGLLIVLSCAAAQSDGVIRALACGASLAVVIVAAVGWIDDHGGLSARARFAAHCAAAVVVLGTIAWVLGLIDSIAGGGQKILFVLASLVPCVAIVWSINLHNFMDGIDGLLACQALFVLGALAVLFAHAGYPAQAACIGALAAPVAGFLPFNFPRARIFMGDVGSGVLGLAIAIGVLWQMTTSDIARLSGVVLCSAFVTDATCTLLSRMVRGRRWYSAHREHLYQWLVRSGFSHAHVVAMYMGWNVLIALPLAGWMNRMALPTGSASATTTQGLGIAVFAYALAVVVWYGGKHACLRRIRGQGRHAAA